MSHFPIRCFTCGKPLILEPYTKKLETGIKPDDALDQLRYRRMCCRRIFLSYPSQFDEDLLLYSSVNKNGDPEVSLK